MFVLIILEKKQRNEIKIIQSGGSCWSWLGKLGKKILTNIYVPLARDNLPGLVNNLTSNAIDSLE